MVSPSVIDDIENNHLFITNVVYLDMSLYYDDHFSARLNEHLCELAVVFSNVVPSREEMLFVIEKDFLDPKHRICYNEYFSGVNDIPKDILIQHILAVSESVYKDLVMVDAKYEKAFIHTYMTNAVAEVYLCHVD